jgi:pimeloyl-ACP methyl ester carboxylesterase
VEKISVNGIQLAYARRGKGTPLVLLHGFPLDHHLWGETDSLLEDAFDLITPDLRGFGESTITDAPCTMEDYASDIAALLDHLDIRKSAIAGHSMGGYVALAFARLYPERISGLGLISTQAVADSPERKEGRYQSAADVAEKGIGGVVEAMTPKFTPDLRLQTLARQIMERQQPAAYIGALKAMAERMDSTFLLSTLRFPVVVVHGNADVLVPVDRARDVKSAVPHAHLVELNGVGHMPIMEAVRETAEALKRLS